MVPQESITLLDEYQTNKHNYIKHISNIDNVYDKDLVCELYEILTLNQTNIALILTELEKRYTYLVSLSYKYDVIIERYPMDDGTDNYFVYLQITPLIESSEPKIFVKPGDWCNN